MEEPLGTTSVLLMWHLARRARQDVTVVLTGQAAMNLGGYRRYQSEICASGFLFQPLALLGPACATCRGFTLGAAASIPVADAQRFEQTYALCSRVGVSSRARPQPGYATDAIRYWLDRVGSPRFVRKR